MAKAALITGGAKRIGKTIALSLAGKGYDIAMHYRTSKRAAETTRASIEDMGVRCCLFEADLGNSKEVDGLIPDVFEAFPELSLLVNNASIFERAPLLKTTPDLFDRHIHINLRTPLFLSKAFALLCDEGHIINLLDTKIDSMQSVYCAYTLSKKALAQFTLLAAKELGPRIRVNGIAPGLIMPSFGMSQNEFERLGKKIPLRNTGHPDRIVQAVNYLLKNPFVTGEILYVDGGEHLK